MNIALWMLSTPVLLWKKDKNGQMGYGDARVCVSVGETCPPRRQVLFHHASLKGSDVALISCFLSVGHLRKTTS